MLAGVAKPAILAAAFTAVCCKFLFWAVLPGVISLPRLLRRRREGTVVPREAEIDCARFPRAGPNWNRAEAYACRIRESSTKLVSLARSLLSSSNARVQPGLPSTRAVHKSIMGAQRVGSHTVQLPTDNIKRRPSHIYIAPQVPAQPHARPTTGLSYEIRKRAQQTWIGPTGAVALHTTGETRNRGALTYGFHKATTLKARVVTPKDGPSSSQRLRIRNKIVRKWLHNSGRSIDRVDTDFVDAASLRECDRFFDALCDSGRTTVSFEALRDSLAHCCGLEVDDEKLEHVVKTIIAAATTARSSSRTGGGRTTANVHWIFGTRSRRWIGTCSGCSTSVETKIF